MSDIEIILNPEDEFTHTPDSAKNYNESMYFNVFDHQKEIGGWFRLGNRPNEGYAEMTCCIYLPDGKVGFMFSRPKIADNSEMNAGGMKFEVIEPFQELRIQYIGKLLILEEPNQMLDPNLAFKNNPYLECNISISIKGLSPMFGGRAVRKDGKELITDPEKSFSKAHYEQHISGQGQISLGDEIYQIEGYGLRDKSWGPRYWQAIDWYRWLTINISKDLGFMISIVKQGEGSEKKGGIVFKNGVYERLIDSSITTNYDNKKFHKDFIVNANTKDEEFEIKGRVISLIPLRNRREDPEGKLLITRITEGMTEYTYQGQVGYGMSEYLDQLIDDEPLGP
tara:strand:+ start:44603 stop:45616 length:1014 start_codon:yes stop_codon:yes gene_type:complete